MSTSVGDLVATLRADTSNFTSGMANAQQSLQGLSSTGTLAALGAALQSAATIATGAFAGGMAVAAKTGLDFDQMIAQAQISLQGLGDTMAQASQKTGMGVNLSEQFGLNPSGTEKSIQLLQGLVGGYATTQATLTALAGAAAVSGQPIQTVTDQVATLANVMANNPQMGQWQGIALAKQNIESYSGVMKAHAEAVGGGSSEQIFDTVIAGLNGSNGAAQQFAQTLTGVKTTLETDFKAAAGTAFQPLYTDLVKVGTALGTLAQSTGAKDLIQAISNEISKLSPDVDMLVQHIDSMGSSSGVAKLLSDLKSAEPLLAAIAGLGAEGAAKHIPGLSGVAGDIGGPASMVAGLVASTAQGRKALEDLAKDAEDLITSLEPIAAEAAKILAVFLGFQPVIEMIAAGAIVWKGWNILQDIGVWALDATQSVKGLVTQSVVASGEMSNLQKIQATAAAPRVAAQSAVDVAQTAETDAYTAAINAQTAAMTVWHQSAAESVAAYAAMDEANLEAAAATEEYIATQEELNATQTRTASLIGSLGGIMTGVGAALTVGIAAWMAYSNAERSAASSATASVQGITNQSQALDMLNSRLSQVQSNVAKTDTISLNPLKFLGNTYDALISNPAKTKGVDQAISTYEGTQSQTNLATFNTQNPAATGNTSQMETRIQAAKEQMAKYQQTIDNGAGVGKGSQLQTENYEIATKSMALLSTQTKQWQQEYSSATAIINAASKETGTSFAQVASQASQFGVDLSQALSTNAGQQSLQALVADVQQAATAIPASIGQMTQQLVQFDNQATGITGAQKFTITPGLINQLGADSKNLTSQGLDPTAVQNDQRQLQPYQGDTMYSVQAINNMVKKNTVQNQSIDLDHQLAQAEIQVVQAAQAVTDAQNNVTKSLWSQIDAQFALGQSLFQQQQSTVQYNSALANQKGAQQAIQASLKGFTDTYWNLGAALTQVSATDRSWASQLLSEVNTLQNLNNQYTILENQYTNANNALQLLTDTEEQYQNIVNKPLAGQSSQQDAIQQNQLAQDAMNMRINQAELQGANTQSVQVINYQNQLDVLTKIGSQLQLQYQMSIGNQQFQIQQAQVPAAVDFNSALAAATAMGKLNTQISDATQKVDQLKPGVDKVSDAIAIETQKIGPQITALQNAASSNQSLINASNGVVTASHSVTNAQQGVTQAQWAALDAQHSLTASQNSYQNSLFSVQDAQRQLTANTLANYQAMSQAVESYVLDAENALKNLQASGTAAANAVTTAVTAANQAKAMNTSPNGNSPVDVQQAGVTQYGQINMNSSQNWLAALYGGASVPGHASGALITQEGMYRGAEGNKPELILPLTDMGRSAALLASYAPGLMGGMSTGGGTTSNNLSSAMQSNGSGGITVGQGAIQVTITGVEGAQDVAGEVVNAVEGALNQILQGLASV